MTGRTGNLKAHFALLVVALIYGFTYSWAKDVMPSLIKPFGFILLRVTSAAILFALIHYFYLKEKVEPRDYLMLAVCSLFGVAANMLMFFKGLSLTTPVNSSVLMLFTPVFVLVFSIVINKRPARFTTVAGILLAAAGGFLLISKGGFALGGDTLTGDLYTIGNAISYGLYLVLVVPLLKKYHPFTVSFWNFAFGWVMVLPFGAGEVTLIDWGNFDRWAWFVLIFVLFGTTFLTYILNAYAIERSGAELAGVYIYLQPVFAGLIAVYSGKDELTLQKVFFIACIFAGVYLASLKTTITKHGS